IGTPGEHVGEIAHLALRGDGQQVVSSAADGLRVWNVEGRLLEFHAADEKPSRMATFGADASLSIHGLTPNNELRRHEIRLALLLTGHDGAAVAVRFTPDGKSLVTAGADKTVRVWNAADGKPVSSIAGLTDAATSLAVSPDGLKLAVGCLDKQARLFTLANGQPVAAWEHPEAVHAVAFSSDGLRLTTSGGDGIVHVWDLATKRELERFAGHEGAALAVAVSSDGKTIVSGAADKTARIWSVSALGVIEADVAEVTDLAFTPDGQSLFTVGSEPEVKRWDATGKLVGKLPGGKAVFHSVAVKPDGSEMAAADREGRVQVWSLADGKLLRTIEPAESKPASAEWTEAVAKATQAATSAPGTPDPAEVGAVAYSADGKRLVVSGAGQVIRIFDAAGRVLERLEAESPVGDVRFAVDGGRLFMASFDNNARARSLSLERRIEAHEAPVAALAVSPDGQFVLSGGTDKRIRLWSLAADAVNEQPVREFVGSTEAITSLAIARDGSRVIAATADGQVSVWPFVSPPAEGQPVDPAKPVESVLSIPHETVVHGVSVSADNLKLATTAEDGVTRVWELVSGRLLQRFVGHAKAALDVAFAPDNKTLVSVGADGQGRIETLATLRTVVSTNLVNEGESPVVSPITQFAYYTNASQAVTANAANRIQLWTVDNGQSVREFVGFEAGVTALAARADGTHLIAATADQKLSQWNLGNAELMTQFTVPGVVRSLRYSADNQRLLAAFDDGMLRVYNAADLALLYELQSDAPGRTAVFSTDGRRMLATSEQGEIGVWAYASPEAIRTFGGHGASVYSVAITKDGKRLASASADQTVRLWNIETGAQIASLTGHEGPVYSLAFSPDDALLVSCGADKTLRLWDANGARQLKQITAGSEANYTVAFHGDGRRVATAGLERQIRTFDVLTGTIQATFDGHTDFVHRVLFNQAGNRLLSCGYGGSLMVRSFPDGKAVLDQRLPTVANFVNYSPDGTRVLVAGGDGIGYIVELPAAAR
ncbi:MAG: WD40 repeat domain-containing protein, partial [Planctomycetales bacterium]|nr:WD40 repeat domain-containing protein [Planctomycetales bacterium]